MKKGFIIAGVGALLLLVAKGSRAATSNNDLIVSADTKSFLGNKYLPRGVRNNNPGNMVISSIAWAGKIPSGKNTDGRFEQFNLFKFGVRAAISNLIYYITHGTNTITKIISAYAPPEDGNDTPAYIRFVSSQSGISASQILTADKTTLKKILIPIFRIENGADYVSDADFNLAYSLL